MWNQNLKNDYTAEHFFCFNYLLLYTFLFFLFWILNFIVQFHRVQKIWSISFEYGKADNKEV